MRVIDEFWDLLSSGFAADSATWENEYVRILDIRHLLGQPIFTTIKDKNDLVEWFRGLGFSVHGVSENGMLVSNPNFVPSNRSRLRNLTKRSEEIPPIIKDAFMDAREILLVDVDSRLSALESTHL